MTLQLATPLRAYLAKSPQPELPIDATALLRELATHAGILPDVGPDGVRFVLLPLPPHLVDALAAHARPTIDSMPLFPGRA